MLSVGNVDFKGAVLAETMEFLQTISGSFLHEVGLDLTPYRRMHHYPVESVEGWQTAQRIRAET